MCPARLHHTPLAIAMHLFCSLLLLKRLKATFLSASETPQRRRRPMSSAAMYVCDSNICSACDASRCRSPIDARLLFAQISSLDSRHGPRRQVLISARDTKNKVHLETREEERNSGVERTRSKNGCNQVLGTLSGGGERQGRCSSRPDRDFRCAHNTHTRTHTEAIILIAFLTLG
jgi:hypothetical protein